MQTNENSDKISALKVARVLCHFGGGFFTWCFVMSVAYSSFFSSMIYMGLASLFSVAVSGISTEIKERESNVK